MIKTKNVALLLLSLLILTACSGQSVNNQELDEINFRTGNLGYELRFQENLPDVLVEGEEVDIILELRNRGAFPQADERTESKGFIYFGGYDPNLVRISNDDAFDVLSDPIRFGGDIDRELEGKSPYDTQGGFKAIDLKIESLDGGRLSEGVTSYRPNIKASMLYQYKTIASPSICVDPNPRTTNAREKTCDFTESIGLSTQGAPVAVTRVEQSVTRDDIIYKIFVRNVGIGRVVDPDFVDRGIDFDPFSEGFSQSDLDKIRVGEVRLGTLIMSECRPAVDNKLRLIDEEATIFCRISKGSNIQRTFEAPLEINLEYSYFESVEAQIEFLPEIEFSSPKEEVEP
jgi:hypothetical protein